jgi:tetratricopeptide (TPR) repeat protein
LTEIALYAAHRAAESRAEDALARRDWPSVDSALFEAERMGAEPQWVDDFRKRLVEYKDYEGMKAQADASERIGNYKDAVDRLRALMIKHPGHDSDLRDQIALLDKKINDKDYRTLMDQARQFLADHKYDEAERVGNLARQVYDTPEVRELLAKVQNDKTYYAWYDRGDKAEKATPPKWADAAIAYKECYNRNKIDAIKAKWYHAEVEKRREVAHTLVEGARLPEAAVIWKEILTFDPNDAEALKFLGARDRLANLKTAKDAGDQAFAAGQWAKAIEQYTEALKYAVDPTADKAARDEMESNTIDCNWHIKVDEAKKAIAEGKFEDAIRILKEADAIKPTLEVKAMIRDLERQIQFAKHIQTVQGLMGQSQWNQAEDELKLAVKLAKSADEISKAQNLQREINYQRAFGKAKALFDAGQYDPALALFNMAQRFKDTPEVQAYIKRCKELIGAGSAGGG